jgi:16S rRNA (adenine(1408)-N(1))-methyltransferase
VVVDVGTGDGRAVLARALRCAGCLVIGMDANAAGMADASRRAAAKPSRGGRSNALFVVAAAETPPAELLTRAAIVTITFPWGSLLRGALGHDETVTAGIAGLLAGTGTLEMLISLEPRDGGPAPTLDSALLDDARNAWLRAGVDIIEAAPASAEDLAAASSSWARKLRAGRDRQVWRLRGVRRVVGPQSPASIPFVR